MRKYFIALIIPLLPLLYIIADAYYIHPGEFSAGHIIQTHLPALSYTFKKEPPANEQYIYFTFDDGPLNGSENIDSVILAEKLKVSVFLVGEHVQKNRSVENYFKYYEENPFIDEYNHSYTHAKNRYEKFYSNPGGVVADILKNQAFLKLQYKIVRLPGRNMWRIGNRKRDDVKSGSAAADSLAQLGYKVIGWDLEWQHNAKTGSPVQTVSAMKTEIEERLKAGTTFAPGHIVILLHDQMFQKKWAGSELKQLLDELRKNPGYVFEQIRFYPAQ
ncbi:MAG: polysaccharide deacetylase family protein [Chitinophagaceae bacterium]|nr:polysaccharide deacetylase family protein [Chitinophagaceae bacterium]